MSHRAAAVLTVSLFRVRDLAARLRNERGQGTVEYVALILLVAGVLAAVVVWAKKTGSDGGQDAGTKIGKTIVGKLNDSIDGVGDPSGK